MGVGIQRGCEGVGVGVGGRSVLSTRSQLLASPCTQPMLSAPSLNVSRRRRSGPS